MKSAGLNAIGLVVTMGLLTVARGYAEEKEHATECRLVTLTGSYVFTATGYNIVSSVPQPKAIVEAIDFKGDGTLTVPAATLSVNGVIRRSVNVSGEYTVNENCTGTITFLPSGPHFDVFIAPNGKESYMIQTDSNTVLAGMARRVSHEHADHDHK